MKTTRKLAGAEKLGVGISIDNKIVSASKEEMFVKKHEQAKKRPALRFKAQ